MEITEIDSRGKISLTPVRDDAPSDGSPAGSDDAAAAPAEAVAADAPAGS